MPTDALGRFISTPPEQRFWRFVDRTDEAGCWPWTGNTIGRGNDPRYGQFSVAQSRPMYAHRYSFTLHKGPIPDGFQVHHVCENRLCVNPAHLEAVHPSHHPDGVYVQRRMMTRCSAGHEYTLENTYIRTTGQRRCRECDRLRYEAKVKPAREAKKSAARAT